MKNFKYLFTLVVAVGFYILFSVSNLYAHSFNAIQKNDNEENSQVLPDKDKKDKADSEKKDVRPAQQSESQKDASESKEAAGDKLKKMDCCAAHECCK